MRLIIALFLPWLTFFTIGRPITGVICLLLQITLIGWIPATIWAVYALGQYKTDQKIEKALGQKRADRP
ncbi:MAG: proteolipid membrane potential modulator [Nitrosomonadales bacterium SCN 54-20]|nr:YqaE/Pmp3 family membrane protein [Nitrosospira multiformis]ODT67154.1 MAG: proteolipid membrane potential modulator [Nitrosomonadales bacterium SCN 54-20]